MEKKKIKVTVDGKDVEIELEKATAEAVEKLVTDNAALMKELEDKKKKDKGKKKADVNVPEDVKELQDKNEDLQKNIDKIQANLDALTEENEKLKSNKADTKTDSKAISAAVQNRLKIEKVARKTLSEEEAAKIDDMDDAEIKIAVLKADSEKFDPEGKSEVYIDARFDIVADRALATNEDEYRGLGKQFITKTKEKAELTGLEKAKADAHKRGLEAWKQPLSISPASKAS